MNKYYYEGKTKEAAIELALQELKISDEDLVIKATNDAITNSSENSEEEKENYDSTVEVTFRALEDYKNFIKQQELKKRQELIEKVKKVIDYE